MNGLTPTPDIQLNENELSRLKQLLDQEIALYLEIESVMQDKRQVIIDGQVEALSVIDQTITGFGQKLIALEQERMSLMTRIGCENMTLQLFIQQLEARHAKSFIDTRARLIRLVESVQAENSHHKSLLNLSLKWIENTVETVAALIAPEAASYDAKGKRHATHPGAKLDPSAAVIAPSTIQREA